jgi:hypothetical protein
LKSVCSEPQFEAAEEEAPIHEDHSA